MALETNGTMLNLNNNSQSNLFSKNVKFNQIRNPKKRKFDAIDEINQNIDPSEPPHKKQKNNTNSKSNSKNESNKENMTNISSIARTNTDASIQTSMKTLNVTPNDGKIDIFNNNNNNISESKGESSVDTMELDSNNMKNNDNDEDDEEEDIDIDMMPVSINTNNLYISENNRNNTVDYNPRIRRSGSSFLVECGIGSKY